MLDPGLSFHDASCRTGLSHKRNNYMILESQLPHQIVDLLFTITHQNNKSTILWGS